MKPAVLHPCGTVLADSATWSGSLEFWNTLEQAQERHEQLLNNSIRLVWQNRQLKCQLLDASKCGYFVKHCSIAFLFVGVLFRAAAGREEALAANHVSLPYCGAVG